MRERGVTSWLLLIDGYNVVAPTAPPGRGADASWLSRARMQLIARLIEHLNDETRRRTCVVFDAANPPRDRPARFEMEGIDVRFAVGYPEADDLLEELIASHSAPKRLAVISSDHRLQTAARRRGAIAFDSRDWLDDLLDGHVRLAVDSLPGAGQGSASDDKKPDNSGFDTDEWMREFGLDEP